MKKVTRFLVILFAFVFALAAPSVVSAQYGQYNQNYPSMNIVVNKMVGMPNSSITDPSQASYVDNLSPSDPRFSPNELVFFKVQVENTSNVELDNVILKDFVPGYLTPLSGPGTFDSSTGTITYTIGTLSAGQEQDFYFKMQVKTQNQLPADKGLFCFNNQAQAYNGQASDSDTSQLCVEKQVTSVTTVPSTGPEFGLVLLGLDIAGIGLGLALKKKLA